MLLIYSVPSDTNVIFESVAFRQCTGIHILSTTFSFVLSTLVTIGTSGTCGSIQDGYDPFAVAFWGLTTHLVAEKTACFAYQHVKSLLTSKNSLLSLFTWVATTLPSSTSCPGGACPSITTSSTLPWKSLHVIKSTNRSTFHQCYYWISFELYASTKMSAGLSPRDISRFSGLSSRVRGLRLQRARVIRSHNRGCILNCPNLLPTIPDLLHLESLIKCAVVFISAGVGNADSLYDFLQDLTSSIFSSTENVSNRCFSGNGILIGLLRQWIENKNLLY